MTPPKKKRGKPESVLSVILERFAGLSGDLSRQFSGLFGMLHEIKNGIADLKARNGTAEKIDRFAEAIPVTHWLISPPEFPPMMPDRDKIRTGGNELGHVLVELAHRAETLHETGRLAVLKYDERKGRLELWCRERIR